MTVTLDLDASKLRLVVNLLLKLDPDINIHIRAIKFSVITFVNSSSKLSMSRC